LKEYFERYGEVGDCQIMTEKESSINLITSTFNRLVERVWLCDNAGFVDGRFYFDDESPHN
jgi:hypothetical protein